MKDAALAIINLMSKIDETRGHAINLGSGSKHRVGDVMELICKISGTALRPVVVEKVEIFKEIEEQWLALDKLFSFLPNFTPIGLEEGLQKTVAWYTEFQGIREALIK